MSVTSDRLGETRTATFAPKRRDDLRPEAVPFIGQTLAWEYLWVLTEDDADGTYAGQVAWQPVDRALPWFGWVPDEDLTEEADRG